MKQSLQLKLGQQLTMTPQLQQAIRLLQLSTLDLQQEIQEALDSNPMLETEEVGESAGDTEKTSEQEASSREENAQAQESAKATESESESTAEGDWNDEIPQDLPVDTSWDDVYESSGPTLPASNYEGDDSDFESRRGSTETLYDHLMWQLNLTPMSERDEIIAMAVLDAVEPSGLLSTTIEEIFEGLAPNLEELELDEVEAVQHRLQQFDPCGVCSENLEQCLVVQLAQFDKDTPFIDAARQIIQQYLPLLGSRDYRQLMRKTRLKEPELAQAIALIKTLNPHPGDVIDTQETEYVVPDVFVEKREGRWTVELNPDIAPRLRINSDYASLVKRADSSSENTYLKNNLQEARWFLKSLQSRNETLLKVATCIVEKQRGFLDYGAEAMKPLVLHDIAELVEMHESTISRVTTQKYMHTPQGIFELKYFFSSHVSTDSGGECSSTAIRAIIKKLVAAENPKKPLSDSKITEMLAEQGIRVARRTIAKYRESLHIPPSNERKSIV
ncbi:RNA polymerase factor sigma-54 [Gilvimarinus sp. SDUM040013]|uniref:RNA polymerase sigma-54 factor n=1 Tax=Gilvimarinus gilvus TaxID=3058038 RepID=A0ABU4RSN3_9GAMM|nr:RNA polymerase factor sigma-54 [Gilvimarinus sp. SDUM040013]MDO3388352.1 RNA polymerase factor sigma-54 [Gilvimarinus sp. SDUM040013]MDX6847902.1 RNA polymerase factor sigma-54 [Gilvimarinus sp. SDUM040013]